MHVRRYLRFFMLCLGLTGLAISTSRASGTLAAGDGSEKIAPELLQHLQAEGRVDFFVRFAEQSELSAAEDMEWSERGWYVYNTLTETAQRSQARSQAYLKGQGVNYRSFIAGNELYVSAGNLEQASSLARLTEVAEIIFPPTYQITPDETSKPELSRTWAGELLANHAESTALLPDAISWGVQDANGDEFWTVFDVRGEDILVANIDTGVRYTHEALYTKYACYDMVDHNNCWYDPDGDYGVPTDLVGHGTHTMGTMVGSDAAYENQIGMAPNAHWIACQGCDGSGCDAVDLAACADWILTPGGNPDNRPQVVNSSWGSKFDGDTWFLPKVDAWRAAGIFPAFSAGNNGPLCGSMGDPGSYQQSFASAAHDIDLREYTNGSRGPSIFGDTPYTKPNLSAPGVEILSSYNSSDTDYVKMNGTSMATPHTAGAVALLWSCNPALIGQVDLTFRILQENARLPMWSSCGTPPDGEGNYSFGYGYLDVLNAGLASCGDIATGTLSGHVYDPVLQPVVGATVIATSTEHNTQALTDITGAYTMTLITGSYDLSASANGYYTQSIPTVEIVLDQTTIQDFNLPFQGLWTQLDALPCANLTRFDAEYFSTTGLVYILGGRYDISQTTSTTLGDIYSLDPMTLQCADTYANMHVPISNYTINLINDGENDLLCTFGGRKVDGSQTQEVQCYNPLTNTVSVEANLPSDYEGFTPGAQVVYNNKVYIFGGVNPTAEFPVPFNLNRTDRYDPSTRQFTQLGNLNFPRSYINATIVDGRIYAFGGDMYNGVYLEAQSIAEVMADPEGAGTWDNEAVGDLPVPLGEGRAFGFDSDSGYDLAGQIIIATQAQWPNASWEVIRYDVLSNTYDVDYPNLNIPRRNHAGVFIPINTPDPTDGLPGMWVLGGFCTGGACGGDLQPYGVPEFFPVFQVNQFFVPLLMKADP